MKDLKVCCSILRSFENKKNETKKKKNYYEKLQGNFEKYFNKSPIRKKRLMIYILKVHFLDTESVTKVEQVKVL